MMRNSWTYRLALVATVFGVSPIAAQVNKAGDLDPTGRVMTKVVVAMLDADAFAYPVRGVNILVGTTESERSSIRTDAAGVASLWLRPGTYRIVNPDPVTWQEKAYTWDVVVTVKPGIAAVRLSQSNATKVSDVAPTTVVSPASPTVPRVEREAHVQDTVSSDLLGKGFHFGVALNGSSIMIDDEDLGESDTENGGGLSLTLGYNLTQKWGALISLSGAAISSSDGDYTLGHADLAARYSFAAPRRSFVPYLEAGLTGIGVVASDEDVELSGGGVTGAAGFNYFFNRHIAFDLNLRYTWGELTTVKFGNTSISNSDGVGVRTARFNLGIAVFP
jgi:outer membrane protein W